MQIANKAAKHLIVREKYNLLKFSAMQNRVARGRFGAISKSAG
jgi:hypothetical protein